MPTAASAKISPEEGSLLGVWYGMVGFGVMQYGMLWYGMVLWYAGVCTMQPSYEVWAHLHTTQATPLLPHHRAEQKSMYA